jgi:predicted dehydrogenase
MKIAILGYGGRGRFYAGLCQKKRNRDFFEIVAVIDKSKEKLSLAKQDLNLNDNQLYNSIDGFCSQKRVADYLFVCTQDKEHFEHSKKALNAGYNLLLEKPIACSISDCVELARTAKEKKLKIDVCHVLRYSGYYGKFKEIIDSGILGKIIAIEQVENVAYWHQAHSFVRGDWRRADESNPMILAKCCHDLDIAVFLSDSKCNYVSSIGKLNYFNKDNAPEGATEYCLNGCKAKAECPYDCEKLYIDSIKKFPKAAIKNMWPQSRLMADSIVTIPKLYDACKNTRYGKCVFLSDNDVVDYQATTMVFDNGITSTLTMTAFSGKESYRQTRIRGSLGELYGNTKSRHLTMEIFGQRPRKITIGHDSIGAHGGGDEKMIFALSRGFIRSDIELSIESHLIAFAAEESRLNNGAPVYIDKYR